MRPFQLSYPIVICLSLLVFAAATTRAEKMASPADLQKNVAPVPSADKTAPSPEDPATLNKLAQFKDNLPETAAELDLPGFVALQQSSKVAVLDVRSKESFARRHIKGSVNAPLTELTEKTLPALLPDKEVPVVLACDYSFQPTRMIPMTLQAYPVLHAAGYKKIYRLNLWSASGGIVPDEAQQKQVSFEGTNVKP